MREALVRVCRWWDELPANLRQDIEGSGAVPGAIAGARSALSAPAQGDGQRWQTMDIAPHDGTEILGLNDDGIYCVIHWGKHNHVPIYGWIRPVELYGEEVDGFEPLLWHPIKKIHHD